MKIYAINGSPRKNKTTAALCEKFLEGAASAGEWVQTKLVHVTDLHFSGCLSCYGCKRRTGNGYGKCAIPDDLYGLLDDLLMADGLLFASPIYFGNITGKMRCFLERLLFPLGTFEDGYRTIAPKRMPIAMLYTMMVSEEGMRDSGYDHALAIMERNVEYVFSRPLVLYAWGCPPVEKLSDYKIQIYSEAEISQFAESQSSIYCQNAYEAGKKMAAANSF